jgi:RecA-family ATPase
VEEDMPPLDPLVSYDERPVLHEGTSLLAAKPKMGKTMLALNISIAVACGGIALGHGEARKGRVLYLDLDGSERDMQNRIEEMCSRRDGVPEALHTAHPDERVPKVNEGMLHYLSQTVPAYELVVIDTLKRIRPRTDGRRNAYDEDYEFLHPIARLGRDHDTSILAVHHLNKSQRGDPLDKVSGSTGLTAAPESVMVLEGERGTGKAELAMQSRRGPDDTFQLEFDDTLLTWKLGGCRKPGTEGRKEVWDHVEDCGPDDPIHYKVLADRLGLDPSTVSTRLNNLFNEDEMPIEKDGNGNYWAG